MKDLKKISHIAAALINEWSVNINTNLHSLFDIEKKVTKFVNKIGHLLLENVLQNIHEPSFENTLMLEGSKAIYKQKKALLGTLWNQVIKFDIFRYG